MAAGTTTPYIAHERDRSSGCKRWCAGPAAWRPPRVRCVDRCQKRRRTGCGQAEPESRKCVARAVPKVRMTPCNSYVILSPHESTTHGSPRCPAAGPFEGRDRRRDYEHERGRVEGSEPASVQAPEGARATAGAGRVAAPGHDLLYAQANVETKRLAIEQADGFGRPAPPPRWKGEPALLAWLDSP